MATKKKRGAKVASASKVRSPMKTLSSTVKSVSMRIDAYSLAYTLGIIAAAKVLLVSIAARMGLMTEGAEIMQKFFLTYNLSFSGILTGMAEAAVCGLVVGFIGGWLYNKFA